MDYLSLFLTICCAFLFAHASVNIGTLKLKIHTFENNLNYQFSKFCCSDNDSSLVNYCEKACSLQFRVCFEDFTFDELLLPSTLTPHTGKCALGQANLTNASRESKGETVISIQAPWPKLYTIILEAYLPKSSQFGQLVDKTVQKGFLIPSSKKQQPLPISITSPTSSYYISLQLSCSEHRFDDHCSTTCKPIKTRFTCDSSGRKVCGKGWSGSNCDIPICRKGCHITHGRCAAPGECICANGWQGELCDECIKYPGCRHGTCDDAPYTCRCLSNWGGPFCDQDLDYCGRHTPCFHGGICKNKNGTVDKFECICSHKWTGRQCNKKLEPCALQPCKRGVCRNRNGGQFQCVCEAGWRGELCDKNIDFCKQNMCLNGGMCQDLDGLGFRCMCQRGFEGSVCQLRSPCSESQCVHARQCTQLATPSNEIEHDCVCQSGWTGDLCDQNIDDCADKCLNGGTCKDLIGDYYCTCPEGFAGRNCEINMKCATNPCQNGGVCVPIDGGFQCICPEGVTGHNCEVAKRGCDPNPCLNHAYCYNLSPNDYYCKCNSSFYGRHCEHRRPFCGPIDCAHLLDPCSPEAHQWLLGVEEKQIKEETNFSIPILPVTFNTHEVIFPMGSCGEHGICMRTEGAAFGCVCETGYEGIFCQRVKNHCHNVECLNGGNCISGQDKFYCICRNGFHGSNCQLESNPCLAEPCKNGGFCQGVENSDDFQCRCAPGWSGRWCQLSDSDPCSIINPCLNGGTCISDTLSSVGFYCQCNFGWRGQTCTTRITEIDVCHNSSICDNDGTCVDVGQAMAVCACRSQFTGDHCQIRINMCNSNPCLNEGICQEQEDGFKCNCAKGFMGHDCRYNIDDCITNPCAHGATCVDKTGDYECLCPEGRSGRHCELVESTTPPKPPSCIFNQRIVDHGDKWSYNCRSCQCINGEIVCEQEFCGYWSCLSADGNEDPFACDVGETCHTVMSAAPPLTCLTPPCYARAFCINDSLAEIDVTARALFLPPPMPLAFPGCQPNAARLTNQCARLLLSVSRTRLPYGVSLEDVCTAVRSLPIVTTRSNSEGGVVGMSCGLNSLQLLNEPNEIVIVEITLSSTDDRIRVQEEARGEYVFVHLFAQNVAAAIRQKASTNLTANTNENAGDYRVKSASVAVMMGARDKDTYWHTILLGVVGIKVETVLVKDEELAKTPMLVPLACSLIIAVGTLCASVVCVCAHRKRQELLHKYDNFEVKSQTTAEQRFQQQQYSSQTSGFLPSHIHTFQGVPSMEHSISLPR